MTKETQAPLALKFAAPSLPTDGAICVLVPKDGKISARTQEIDKVSQGALTRLIALKDFSGDKGKSLVLPAPAGTTLDALVLVGLGDGAQLDDLTLQEAAGLGLKAVEQSSSLLYLDADGLSADQCAALAKGLMLRRYHFDDYLTIRNDKNELALKEAYILCDAPQAANLAAEEALAIAAGVNLTRDLVSEPANVLYPETFAARALAELEPLGVGVEVFDEKQLSELGFGSLLGVAQGSDKPARMVIMKWDGGAKGERPISFIGKGVTFDTGGISLKPAGGMEDMKWDMGGAGVVVGLMKALAGRKAKANVVAAIGCVENMPSGNAQRPGDIVKSYSGQTIEVLNTDAEGRLVLADVLSYINEQYEPKFMVDLATLTGAILVALGTQQAGLFSNDETLTQQILKAGKESGDPCWHMPIGSDYNKLLDTSAADMKNISAGRWGGSITAACFLERFVGETTWAHLDIAGVTWGDTDKPTQRKGATGWGVRILDRLVKNHYEQN